IRKLRLTDFPVPLLPEPCAAFTFDTVEISPFIKRGFVWHLTATYRAVGILQALNSPNGGARRIR
ncbi:hypothetical protein PSYMO_35061, partial [Pseudomonas amygdali pv. mori str. 301020]